MHPAASVIFFTTASGAGYGLLFWLGLCAAAGLLPPDRWLGLVSLSVATTLIVAGLLSSALHLGRPERAWRAFSQWRSSWLSREGVAAVAAFFPLAGFAFGWIVLGRTDGAIAVAGLVSAIASAVTVYCTGMIYASLKPIRQWSTIWTTPVYLALGGYSGAVLLALLTLVFSAFRPGFGALVLLTLVIGAVLKFLYWRAIDAEPPRSTLRTATGLARFEKVRLFEAPHTEANYIMMEMGFQIARKHAAKLRRVAWLTLFALPAAFMIATLAVAPGLTGVALTILATLSAGVGVAVERWLFFAEATHASMIYYGQAS